MRIGINTRFLIKDKLEGLGVYTQEVSSRLAKLYPEHEWYFIFDRKYDDSFISSSNIIPVQIGPPARHPLLWYWWFEKSIPATIQKYSLDLFFSTDGYLSLKAKIPQLLTIHDLAFEYYPEGIPTLAKNYYQYFTPKFCQKAEKIIAISQNTHDDLTNKYGIDENKISLIPNGVSDEFGPLNETEKQNIRSKFSQGKPYFLYVGSVHPRKNVISLLKAFEKYKSTFPDARECLLIVGRDAWGNPSLKDYLQSMRYREDVIWQTTMDRKLLIKIIGAATCMVYISLYEGFGLPVLESMKSGVTVITSESSPMSEILQDGGFTVNPLDINQVSNAMRKVASENQLREELERRCLELSEGYHWNLCAQSTGKLIESILEA